MKHIRCVRGTTLRGMLLFATAAMTVGIAQSQTTPSTQNNPGNAAPGTPNAAPAGPQTFQPAPGQTNAQPGQPSAQPSEQRAGQRMANQDDAIGAKFETAGNGKNGLRVQTVEPNGPAAQAGLQVNDTVISADGRPFRRARHLEAYLSAQAGRPVPLVVDRNGRQTTIELMPQPTEGEHGWLGVLLQEPDQNGPNAAGNNAPNEKPAPNGSTPNAQGASNNKGGAEVAEVAPEGPAARAGLRPGDIIIQVNGKQIDDAAELVADIHEMKPQSKAEFTVMRDNQEQKIPVTLGNRSQEMAEGPGPGQPGQGQGQFGPGQMGGPFPGQFPPRQFPGGGFGGGQQMGNLQQIVDQNQRIEQELQKLREEVKQLRDQLQKK